MPHTRPSAHTSTPGFEQREALNPNALRHESPELPRPARQPRALQHSSEAMKSLYQELQDARLRLRRLREIAKKNIASQAVLGVVVRELRESRKIKMRVFSKKAGVGFGMLYGLETQAQPNPTYNNLVRIAAGFNMPLSELIAKVEARQSDALKADAPREAESA